MALSLNHLMRVVNVHWDTGEGFLYSGADGMFGSTDGEDWQKAPASVAATSLACIDGVWIGCNGETIWRSTDGAESWTIVAGPKLTEVVAFQPQTRTADGELRPGTFVGWVDSSEDESDIPAEKIYTSQDGGKTWDLSLSIPTEIGDENGSEFVQCISACGQKAFVSTSRQETQFHHGDGMLYTSTDGSSFVSSMQFGPGDVTPADQPNKFPRRGYAAMGVGFDSRTERYVAAGHEDNSPSFGVATSRAIYAEVGAAGSGTELASATYPETVSESLSVGGGNGMFCTGISTASYPQGAGAVRPVPGTFMVQFFDGGSGSTTLFSLPDIFDDSNLSAQIGPFVFQPAAEEDAQGTFACVAFRNGPAALGGVWIAKEGATSFRQTHSGTALDSDPSGRRGGLGFGTIGWLGSTA